MEELKGIGDDPNKIKKTVEKCVPTFLALEAVQCDL